MVDGAAELQVDRQLEVGDGLLTADEVREQELQVRQRSDVARRDVMGPAVEQIDDIDDRLLADVGKWILSPLIAVVRVFRLVMLLKTRQRRREGLESLNRNVPSMAGN